ncbi:hypothetical protein LINGRAHAP2_LOCUS32990 [Linum grandiflorum]
MLRCLIKLEGTTNNDNMLNHHYHGRNSGYRRVLTITRGVEDQQNDDKRGDGVFVEKDDFRPTTPGHSPGAGHSTGPSDAPN